eukprot:TRINITY_DN9159_c0_g1_i3.p1 TRINITY_DN9159_c0_g1~~TRINITY_DN9159_c0_g1_i3.p1  ORF type:complete len:713 (+),score=155.28 TRINITY_DN9159_c0_g1_i3:348-2486(+)
MALSDGTSSSNQPRSNSPSTSRFHQDFDDVVDLGHGTFGKVMKARHRLDNRIYAVKKLRIDHNDSSNDLQHSPSKVLREVSTLSRLAHPNIVRYQQAWVELAIVDALQHDDDDIFDEAIFHSPRERDIPTFHAEHESFVVEKCADCGCRFQSYAVTISDMPIALPEEHRCCQNCFLDRLVATGREALVDEVEFELITAVPEPKQAHYLFIQMEFCEVTLQQVLSAQAIPNSNVVWTFLKQILSGLAYVHDQNIVHRDLKPANIFVSWESALDKFTTLDQLKQLPARQWSAIKCKIGDFGLAKETQPAVEHLNDRRVTTTWQDYLSSTSQSRDNMDDTTDIGTVLYLPPSDEIWSDKIDMYALGITTMELFSRFNTGMERFQTLSRLRRPVPEFPQDFERTHFEAAIMMRRLLQRDPDRRPSAQDMLTMVQDRGISALKRSDSSPCFISTTLANLAEPSLGASLPSSPGRMMMPTTVQPLNPPGQSRMDELIDLYCKQHGLRLGSLAHVPPSAHVNHWSSSRRPSVTTAFAKIDERSAVEWCQSDTDDDDEDLDMHNKLSARVDDNEACNDVFNALEPRKPNSALTSRSQPDHCANQSACERAWPIPTRQPAKYLRPGSPPLDHADNSQVSEIGSRFHSGSWPPKESSSATLTSPQPSSGHLLNDSTRISIQDEIILHLQQRVQQQEAMLMEREREITFLRSLLGSRTASVDE